MLWCGCAGVCSCVSTERLSPSIWPAKTAYPLFGQRCAICKLPLPSYPFLPSEMDQDGLFLMLKMCNGCSHNKVRVTAGYLSRRKRKNRARRQRCFLPETRPCCRCRCQEAAGRKRRAGIVYFLFYCCRILPGSPMGMLQVQLRVGSQRCHPTKRPNSFRPWMYVRDNFRAASVEEKRPLTATSTNNPTPTNRCVLADPFIRNVAVPASGGNSSARGKKTKSITFWSVFGRESMRTVSSPARLCGGCSLDRPQRTLVPLFSIALPRVVRVTSHAHRHNPISGFRLEC